MTNQTQNTNVKNKYNLAKRTSKFGAEIIIFVRSATGIGANYMEADCAESKKDFIHKIGISKKEAKETTHWLHMLAIAESNEAERCRRLWQEAHELTLIFSAIVKRKY